MVFSNTRNLPRINIIVLTPSNKRAFFIRLYHFAKRWSQHLLHEFLFEAAISTIHSGRNSDHRHLMFSNLSKTIEHFLVFPAIRYSIFFKVEKKRSGSWWKIDTALKRLDSQSCVGRLPRKGSKGIYASQWTSHLLFMKMYFINNPRTS